ncbi:hypothetical protein LZ017_04450 [Pelomonas sp. CA6]|uniref:hypothetical protein n=1 Tax=Pelomonas sp. CA6 TaxID=2907999 RepID=UPI001F4A9D4E|nr:hypothetical protein [Pelomonas sp. CA6]MCH7342628.1 hypothetical protein [Pelomonas sp. CA6]
MDHHLACFSTEDSRTVTAPEGPYRWRLLAQGDSWFSASAAKLNAHANLLQELVFKEQVAAVNCAGQREALARLVDLTAAADFRALLCGDGAPTWDGILLSVCGNDLVQALQSPALDPQGQEVPLHLRLLRRQTEWGPPSAGVGRYFSEPGWQTFADYVKANLRHLLGLRDSGPSAGRPVFLHCYAVPVPRPAGSEDGSGPWLLPTLKAYAIPSADWAAVSRLLVLRLAQLFKSLMADREQFPGLFVFDSTAVPLAPATPGSGGISGDWHNEIHLNHSGCFKIGRAWSEHIQTVLTHGGLPAAPAPSSGRRRSS